MGLVIDPVSTSAEEAYLDHLNRCFPGWGDRVQFDWVFHRDSGAGQADLLYARFDNAIIGGTGVTYRRVMHPSGRESKIGIMTGSWVLPAARGKGCFTAMIDAMTAWTTRRGGSLLVAYAFESNPSYRAMARAGLATVETSYLRDPQEYQLDSDLKPLAEMSVGDRSAEFANAAADRVCYVYSADAWREQFLPGENPRAFLELPGGGTALVEEANGFLRVQALSLRQPASYTDLMSFLYDCASRRQHRLFLFSVDEALTRASINAGCERIAGGYFMRIADRQALADWVGSDDAESLVETNLLDAGHPAYLAAWRIQNRDRM